MSKEIKLTFLGTGDSIPSKTRNHSAFFLEYDGKGLLFDCGEGTQRQFRQGDKNIMDIDYIFISHWHGDHVLGLPGLIQTLVFCGYNKKLVIIGPEGTKKFMSEMFKVFVFSGKLDFEIHEVKHGKILNKEDFFVESERMDHGIACNAYSFVIKEQIRIDKKKLSKLKLKPGAYLGKIKQGKDVMVEGKKIRYKDITYVEAGKKISIVMDTKMNSRIVPFVKQADALIIESGFGEDLKEKAEEHKHMSSKQVGEIAKKAKIGKLYLTHLSSRYKDQKEILNEVKKYFKNVELAKDLMEITI